MNRDQAYQILATELRSLTQQGYDALLPKVGKTTQRLLNIGQEPLTVEVLVRWDDVRKRTIRVDAVALGPSCWKLDRLEESIVVRPPP
jgi:hypothetical protein